MYTKEVIEHFQNPRNMGEMENPDGEGQVGNLKCGDVMRVFLRIKKREAKSENPTAKIEEEYIDDIKFQTLGCAAAIASSSMMTELVKGKSLEEAAKVSKDDINEALGKLPAQKYHCSILSADAIKKAIEDYRTNHGKGHGTPRNSA